MQFWKKLKNNVLENPIEYLFYLFVFLLPWQMRWIVRDFLVQAEVFEYGRISLYAFDILLIVILLYTLIVRLLNKGDKAGRGKKSYSFSVFVFLCFCVLVFLSTFWADDKLISLYWAMRMLAGFGLFYLIGRINFSKVRLAIVVVVAGAIQGLLAIWQFINQEVWASKWLGMAYQSGKLLGASVVEFGLERWLRAYGSVPHPNILGAFLVLSFIAVVYLITRLENKYQKLFLIFSSSFIVLGILFSYSRSAWLVFGLIFIAGFIWLLKLIREDWIRRFTKWLFLYLLILLTLFSLTTLSIVKTRLNIGAPARLEIKSNTERLESYRQAGQIIKDHAILGVGIGNYTFELQNKYPDLVLWDIQPVHNVYLLILAELGLFGFLILGLAIGYILVRLIRCKKWSFVFVFLCLSVLVFFDHFWWTTASGLYVGWLVLGLVTKSFSEIKNK